MSPKGEGPRVARMVGGHLDGEEVPLRLPDGLPDPLFRCHRGPGSGGRWEHYTRQGDGTYRHVGECGVGNHGGRPLPGALTGCCCGRPGCTGTGPWPHNTHAKH